MSRHPLLAGLGVVVLLGGSVLEGLPGPPVLAAQTPQGAAQPAATLIDPYAPKPRLLVLTDIANEPDDQMSLVRLLVYANQFDLEGLVATTSTWMKKTVRPDVIRLVIDAYAQVQPNLLAHQPGFPTASALRDLVSTGQPEYGMAVVGSGKASPGSQAIIRALDRPDPRPLWISVWGGANTLAQALLDLRTTRSPAELEPLLAKLRVYAISDQDDAGPWIRREFPTLHYIAMPSPANGEQYDVTRRGPASAATASIAMRPAPTSRLSPMRGSTPRSARRAPSGSTIPTRAAFTRATHRPSWASSTTGSRAR